MSSRRCPDQQNVQKSLQTLSLFPTQNWFIGPKKGGGGGGDEEDASAAGGGGESDTDDEEDWVEGQLSVFNSVTGNEVIFLEDVDFSNDRWKWNPNQDGDFFLVPKNERIPKAAKAWVKEKILEEHKEIPNVDHIRLYAQANKYEDIEIVKCDQCDKKLAISTPGGWFHKNDNDDACGEHKDNTFQRVYNFMSLGKQGGQYKGGAKRIMANTEKKKRMKQGGGGGEREAGEGSDE